MRLEKIPNSDTLDSRYKYKTLDEGRETRKGDVRPFRTFPVSRSLDSYSTSLLHPSYSIIPQSFHDTETLYWYC